MAKVKVTGRGNGPLMIDGLVTFIDNEGKEATSSRARVHLWRCGASGMKPFCGDSHRTIRFEAPKIELVLHGDS